MVLPAGTNAATEALAGPVERVTFHNEENGFCVLRVKARGQRDLITVLGHAAMISAGEFVQASGAWVNDRTHGVQFRASFLKAMPPTTTEGIEKSCLPRPTCQAVISPRAPVGGQQSGSRASGHIERIRKQPREFAGRNPDWEEFAPDSPLERRGFEPLVPP